MMADINDQIYEQGREDALAKLERLLRAGWEVYPNGTGGITLYKAHVYKDGATLAEALAQVPDL